MRISKFLPRIILGLGVLTGTQLAHAYPGDLDPTFSSDGKVETSVMGNDYASSIAVQSDDKVVVLGCSSWWTSPIVGGVGTSDGAVSVARFTTSGALDTTFSGDGLATISFGSDYSEPGGVAVQSDGKIVVTVSNGTTLAAARLTSTGSLDTTFGSGGKFIMPVNLGGAWALAHCVRVMSDGKILIVGTSGGLVLIKLNSNGTLDTTFNSAGYRQLTNCPIDGFEARFQDSKILVVGTLGNDMAIARLNSDGTLDSTFSSASGGVPAGARTIDFGTDSTGKSIFIQSDGKILLGGSTNGNFAAARLNSDGTLDTSFSLDGLRVTDFGGSDSGASIVAQPNGKIWLCGTSDGKFAAVRYNSDGTSDTTATSDGTGKVITDFGVTAGAVMGRLTSDSRYVVGGTTTHLYTDSYGNTVYGGDFAVVRYLGPNNPPSPVVKGTSGKKF